ncbi:methyltransferase domain-containing protein [Jannaschia sp. Os4]|uniref:methyltransferase domain-containing protein n=1 Tax=Jannaschia sp. Os4 TaxID=2807617 RepID=UPI001939DCF5|nr:methyltransferase domain-containing protein [Jannaschia sp. Os4]
MTDRETLSVYDAQADRYARDHGHVPPDLAPFAALLPEGGRVLDLGCGPGHCAGWLAEQGFEAHAWDAAPAMVAHAAARPGVHARRATFDEVEDGWDGVWASFSFLHAPRAEVGDLIRRWAGTLRPGGAFFVGMKTGEGEARDTLGRRYSYVTEAELRDYLERAGLRIHAVRRGREPGLSGEAADYACLTAVAPGGTA